MTNLLKTAWKPSKMTLLPMRKTVPDVSLQIVFRTIAESALKLNKKKCEIREPKICYFGNVITEKGLGPEPEKVIAFEELPVPKNVSELRQLLRMISYRQEDTKAA